jgi:Fur family ferric uptake transcriptional regulator
MCHRCDYSDLLKACQLGVSANRLCVLEVIGNTNASINRVTVYRILDLLVDRGLVQRLSGGGRSFVYGLAPNEYHPAHSHFYCKSCGHMECLNPQSLNVDTQPMQRTFAGLIENVEVRVDGVCKTCLQTENGNAH